MKCNICENDFDDLIKIYINVIDNKTTKTINLDLCDNCHNKLKTKNYEEVSKWRVLNE